MDTPLDPQFDQINEQYRKAIEVFGICKYHKTGPQIYQCRSCTQNNEEPVRACILCVDDETTPGSHHGHRLKLTHSINCQKVKEHIHTMQELISGKIKPAIRDSPTLEQECDNVWRRLNPLENELKCLVPIEVHPNSVESQSLFENFKRWKQDFDDFAGHVRQQLDRLLDAATAIDTCDNEIVTAEDLEPVASGPATATDTFGLFGALIGDGDAGLAVRLAKGRNK